MNDQAVLEKHEENLLRQTVICAYIAAEHTKAKEEIKVIKELIKERKEKISKKIGEQK